MSIARHTAYNVIGAVLPIAVSLVTVPLYLKVIGLDRYGVLNLCWLLVGYFGFFDFGLGRATAQQIAMLHDGEAADRSRAFWTSLSLSAALAVIAAVVALPLAWFALSMLKLDDIALEGEVQKALPLLVVAVPLAIFQSVLKGALEGRRQFFLVNAIMSTGAIATGVLPLTSAVLLGPAIPLLIAVSLAVRCCVVIGLAVAAIRAVPLRTYESSDRLARRKMMRFGGWLTVTNIIGPLMVFSDRFLIGAIAGAAAVALYAIPFNLISQLLVLPQSLSNALFPRFAAGQSERLSSEALLATTFVLTPIAMVAMLLVGPFLRLWIGEAAALQSTPIALVLITGFWANGLAQLPFASLQAAGRTDVTAKLHLVELVPYFALLWLGLNTLGVVGAALAWSIRVAVDFVALAILDRIDMKVFRLALIQAVPVVVLALVMVETGASSLMRYSAALLICLITGIYLARVVPEVVLERVRLWLAPLRKVLPQ